MTIVVSAFAALTAQAQEAQAAAPAASTNTTSVVKNAGRPVMLASRISSGSGSGSV